MKKFLLFLPFVLMACSARQPQYRIGVSQCLDDAWRQKMNYEMERELLLHPDMHLTHRIAYGSNELQCAQIDSFIRERVDLLIVSPNEAEQVKPAVTRAYRAGIPVIVADRRVTGDEWTAFIGGDNYKVGQLMAKWVIGKLKIKNLKLKINSPFTVLEVAGLPGSTPATLRHKGLVEGLGGLPVAINSVMGSWYKEEAYQVVTDYLATHPLPDVIVAHNDLMAIGAAEAVKNHQSPLTPSSTNPLTPSERGAGGGSLLIMGVDGIRPGLQAITEGKIECTATYSSRGDMIIDAASRILHHQPFVRDTVLETVMVDVDAAYPMLKQDEAIARDLETLHIVQVQTQTQWKQLQYGRIVLISCLVAFFVLLIIVLAYIIRTQLKMQTEIKSDILPQLNEVQEAIQVNRKDEAFAERMKQIVEDHLSDPNLNVEYLGTMLQLSRTQLFRRVKSVTGKGPLDYIRERRLIKADQLLHTTDKTIQQISLELCFSNPGYFTKCYKEYFGHLPSERS